MNKDILGKDIDISNKEQPIEENKIPTINQSSTEISKGLFWNFMRTYGSIPLNLLMTIFLSRLIDRDTWGMLIYSTIIITSTSIIMQFFPPSIDTYVLYKIPELLLFNQNQRVKTIIINSIKVKIKLCIVIIIIFLFGAYIYYINNPTSLYPMLIVLQTPIILFFEIKSIMGNLMMAMKYFKLEANLYLFGNFFFLANYVIFYFGQFDISINLMVYWFAFLNTLIFIIQLIIYWIIFHQHYSRYKIEPFFWKNENKITKFGIYYSVFAATGRIYEQLYTASINYYELPRFITYNKICMNISNQTIGGFAFPMGTVLSDLEKSNQREKMIEVFGKTLVFTNILICFLIGALYFFLDTYIIVMYPPEYIEVIPIARLIVFYIFFYNLIISYRGLFSITNNEKKLMNIEIIYYLISSILAFYMMITFSFSGIIASRIIGTVIGFLFYWIISKKQNLYNANLNLFVVLKPFFLLITIIIGTVFFSKFITPVILTPSFVSNIANLIQPIFNFGDEIDSQIYSILYSIQNTIIFCILFVLFVILFKMIRKSDIEQLEKIQIKIPFKSILLKILKKIVFI